MTIDPQRVMANGASSGGDMAIQFHVSFSAHIKGVCGFDAQPFRCATQRFAGDALLPQTHESSTPHCFGCPPNRTLLYDHCKSHAHWVNSTLLAEAARALPKCPPKLKPKPKPSAESWAEAEPVPAAALGDCIDDTTNLATARIFLTRGECRTYTGSAVENSREVYSLLGAKGMKYFDQCNPDGSHKGNDTVVMCFDQVFGPLKHMGVPSPDANFLFDQRPFIDDVSVGVGDYGYAYVPPACAQGKKACGLQVSFHGCGGAFPPSPKSMAYAESNAIVLLHPNIPNRINGNNATGACNAGSAVSGNCKEISRGCWDGYGQLSEGYVLQSAAHMRAVGEAFNAQDAFELHRSASGPVDASGRVNVFGHVMAEVLSTNAQMNDEINASAETSPAGANAVADAEPEAVFAKGRAESEAEAQATGVDQRLAEIDSIEKASGLDDAFGLENVFGHEMAEVQSTNAQTNDEIEARAETSPAVVVTNCSPPLSTGQEAQDIANWSTIVFDRLRRAKSLLNNQLTASRSDTRIDNVEAKLAMVRQLLAKGQPQHIRLHDGNHSIRWAVDIVGWFAEVAVDDTDLDMDMQAHTLPSKSRRGIQWVGICLNANGWRKDTARQVQEHIRVIEKERGCR
eukprot:g2666.t1